MRPRLTSLLLAAAVCGASLCPVVSEARPTTPAERRYVPWSSLLPQCSDPSVLNRVQARFRERESDYWQSGLEITTFDRIRETGFRTTGLDYIPRRYCSARAVMNDQKVRAVTYSIAEDMDTTGGDALRSVLSSLSFGLLRDGPSVLSHWGVDWCVSGLDRNYAYGTDCQAAKP